MLSQMNLKIRSCIIFFITALMLTTKFVNVLMSFFVVSQDPHLPKLSTTTRVGALKLLNPVFLMRCEMVDQMLWHFETLVTTLDMAGVFANGYMAIHMLPQF